MTHRSNEKGLTVVELLVTISILLIIFAFAGIGLFNIIPDASLREAMEGFSADARSQQDLAMMGQSGQPGLYAYGVKLESDRYTLFRGEVYDPGASQNYTVLLPQNVVVASTLPSDLIVFLPLSGDVKDYTPTNNQVTLTAPNNRSYVLRFNKIGNIYYVNRL